MLVEGRNGVFWNKIGHDYVRVHKQKVKQLRKKRLQVEAELLEFTIEMELNGVAENRAE